MADDPGIDGLAETVLEGGARVSVDLDGSTDRYEEVELIGRGGMGEVWATRDTHIGRQVAIKRLRDDRGADDEALARFIREARVQGQLEHPAIVPVYDMDTNGGRPYFSMRRVKGIDLRHVLAKLREEDPGARETYSRRRLLEAFGRVLLAIDYAHQHGVIHRDLKPSNIMLGDFGEVYVLDWGVAKILGAEDVPEETPTTKVDLETWEGAFVGTPGYVAPEQLTPDGTIDGRSDVFALGTMLFEILTLAELFPGSTPEQRTGATLAGADLSRAQDADVPPELMAITRRATAQLASDRYDSVRLMQQALESYLEGDRDLELRRAAAAQHASTAEGVARFALERGDATDADRSRAFREVSRALAFDPENTSARATMVRLLTEPPPQRPKAVDEMISRSQNEATGSVFPASIASHVIGLVLLTPLLVWMGIESWTAFFTLAGLNLITLLYTILCWRRHQQDRLAPHELYGIYVLNLLWTGALSMTFGPFLLVPGLAAIHTVNATVLGFARNRTLLVLLGCMTFLVPFGLQELGLAAVSYDFTRSAMTLEPWLHGFPWPAAPVVLVLAHVVMVAVSAAFVGRFRDALDNAEARVALNAWQLRQLAPDTA